MDKSRFMQMAINEARRGIELQHGGPFGCVIVKDNKVISKGHNRVVANNDPTCHGEIDAIRKACKKVNNFSLKGCELYTTGYPCPMCFCAILWANIDKVYYGCNTTDTKIIGFRDKEFEQNIPNKKIEMCEELAREDCLRLYKEYKDLKNKTMY